MLVFALRVPQEPSAATILIAVLFVPAASPGLPPVAVMYTCVDEVRAGVLARDAPVAVLVGGGGPGQQLGGVRSVASRAHGIQLDCGPDYALLTAVHGAGKGYTLGGDIVGGHIAYAAAGQRGYQSQRAHAHCDLAR